MRKIKFRAWDKEDKEMFRVIMLAGDTDDQDNLLVSGRGGTTQGAILMQYTGLKDNTHWSQLTKEERQDWISKGETNQTWHGKEIYEGDICKWLGCEVSQGKQIRPQRIKEITGEIYSLYETKNIIEGNGTFEIIGNIYENPELLKLIKDKDE